MAETAEQMFRAGEFPPAEQVFAGVLSTSPDALVAGLMAGSPAASSPLAAADARSGGPGAWVPVFLAAVKLTGNLSVGCKAAGVCRRTVYDKCRRQPAFARRLQAARAEYYAALAGPEGVARG